MRYDLITHLYESGVLGLRHETYCNSVPKRLVVWCIGLYVTQWT